MDKKNSEASGRGVRGADRCEGRSRLVAVKHQRYRCLRPGTPRRLARTGCHCGSGGGGSEQQACGVPLSPADDEREELRPPCDLFGLPIGPTALVRVSIPVLIIMNVSNLKKDGLFHLSL